MKQSLELTKQKDIALGLMDKAGFPVTVAVLVEEDPQLKIMGYTTERDGKKLIVVSSRALAGKMALNLLIHELSHVYRIHSGHPSHDNELLSTITGWAIRGHVVHDYQEEIVRNALNILEDIYADDISFAIFSKEKTETDLSAFFLSWIREPSQDKDLLKKSWKNADCVLNAAFAQANIERHEINDTNGQIHDKVSALLQELGPQAANKFVFFKDFMVKLPKDPTKKEFESLLISYLSEFLKLTKIV